MKNCDATVGDCHCQTKFLKKDRKERQIKKNHYDNIALHLKGPNKKIDRK